MASLPAALSRTQGGQQKKSQPGGRYSFLSVNEKTVIDFTRNLGVMIKARVPLLEALDTAIRQTSDTTFKAILGEVRRGVKSGRSLAESLAGHPDVFDAFFIHLVNVGEVTGVLDEVLLRLADYKAKRHSLIKKVKMAMIYPGLVLSVATGAILFLLLFIVPTFAEMYRDYNAELPGLTQFVLYMSSGLANNFMIVLITAGVGAWLVWKGVKIEKGRYLLDTLKLKAPFFGELFAKTLIVRFCQTLGTLLQSGITLVDGLDILKKSSGNMVVTEETGEILRVVKKGKSFGGALKGSSVFPPVVLQMISVGEETAELDRMLLHIAGHFQEEVDIKVDGMTAVIEPLLIIVLGIILGFIVVALYLPMFELMNVIQ